MKQLSRQENGAADEAVNTTLDAGGDLGGRLHSAVELSDVQPLLDGQGALDIGVVACEVHVEHGAGSEEASAEVGCRLFLEAGKGRIY